MFHLGKRRNQVPAAADPPPDPAADDEPVARACWLVVNALRDPLRTMWRGEANTPLVDLGLDLRAVLVRTAAGRRVFGDAVANLAGADFIDRLTADRDQWQRTAEDALNRLAEVRQEAEGTSRLLQAANVARAEAEECRDYLVNEILNLAPEDWDDDAAGSEVAVRFVKTVVARAEARGVPLERFADATAEVPALRVDNVKMTREALCVAQTVINARGGSGVAHLVRQLQRLINECDRHRPIGADGRHGNLHTPTCGCEDKPTGWRWRQEHPGGTVRPYINKTTAADAPRQTGEQDS